MGREILADLRSWDRTPAGYASLNSVITKRKRDAQPSFALAETFKYLYLLFDPAALDFEAVTFNTEAHPLRRAGGPARGGATASDQPRPGWP